MAKQIKPNYIYADAEEKYVKNTVFYAEKSSGGSDSAGTPVPIGEHIDDIFINTSLSADEVKSIIDGSISSSDNGIVVFQTQSEEYLFVTNYHGNYEISLRNESGERTTMFNGDWTSEANSVITVNEQTNSSYDGYSGYMDASYNQKLANLISITPFAGAGAPYAYKEETLENAVSKEELENAFLKGLIIGIVSEGKVSTYAKPLTCVIVKDNDIEYGQVIIAEETELEESPEKYFGVYSKEYK